jgi:branched-subunit amino acid transport protein
VSARSVQRFTNGAIFGAVVSGIAYGTGASPLWTVLVGMAVACLIWSGPGAARALAELRRRR